MAEDLPHPIKYLSFGSPLMDCIADVSREFIQRNEIELDTTIHKSLRDIKFLNDFFAQHKITYIPGGCQFNAMRVFNWMLDKDETDIVGFLGSVGADDPYGDYYQELLSSENIIPIFESIEKEVTGLCIVICCNRDRAHITDLGASISISETFAERYLNSFKNLKLIYTELFILKTKKEICYEIAKLGLKDETIYGFNLPSEFFLRNYTTDITKLCEYADIIFANHSEAIAFCKFLNLKIESNESVEDIAELLCKNITKKNKNKTRIVVITCGPHPAACCEYDHKNEKVKFKDVFDVHDVPPEKIVDTNGAGDSFAGGFLSQLVKGKDLRKCMDAGHWAASVIIQRRGCEIPVDIKYE